MNMLSPELQGAVYSVLKDLKTRDLASLGYVMDEITGPVQEMVAWMQENGISVLVRGHSCVGGALGEVRSFVGQPYVAYLMGNCTLLDMPKLGMVGPRRPSSYGMDVIRDICVFLPTYDLVTISGGAEGIDMMAHRCSLDNGVPTIVVLGAGIRWYLRYGSGGKRLLQEVVERGGLIYSAFKLDQGPTTFSFPQRNKYIAGMSTCIFVPEAGVGSGSLITVDFAAAMRTPCYSVPQSIYAASGAGVLAAWNQGKISLVSDLVIPFKHFSLRNGGVSGPGSDQSVPGVVSGVGECPQDVVAKGIWKLLEKYGALSADDIVVRSSYEPSELLGALAVGEMEGFWREMGDGKYQMCCKVVEREK